MPTNRETIITHYSKDLGALNKWSAFFIKEGEKEIKFIELLHLLDDMSEEVETGLTEADAVAALFMTPKKKSKYYDNLDRLTNKIRNTGVQKYVGESLIKVKS